MGYAFKDTNAGSAIFVPHENPSEEWFFTILEKGYGGNAPRN
jgi:hypothetical protein